jgi:outer membrane receptor for monomeric catechols
MKQLIRRTVVPALSVLALATGVLVSATPAQAATYVTFKNEHSGTCLTGGKTGTVFVSTCNGSWYQQWAKASSGCTT